MTRRANYALTFLGVHLGNHDDTHDVPWATFEGNRAAFTFEVGTDDATDAYVLLQAYRVGEYGHEILVNGDPLTGFDVAPHNGWQVWMDAVTGASLREGTNELAVERDSGSSDEFAVGNVAVHWREPAPPVP